MKSNYPEFFEPDEEALKELWSEATFVFDANSLLDLYRLSSSTVDSFFQAIETVKDRLWLPYQADFEYSKNRRKVVEDYVFKFPNYASVKDELSKIMQSVSDRKHPIAAFTEILNKTKSLESEACDISIEVDKAIADYRVRCSETDARLDQLFTGKIGKKPGSPEDLRKTVRERFKNLTPPGYLDIDKEDDFRKEQERPKGKVIGDPFGDGLIWLELLECNLSDLIYITSEKKADWWLEIHGRTLSPRPELIREMREHGKKFYLYKTESFIEIALSNIPADHRPAAKELTAAVEEVRNLDDMRRTHNILLSPVAKYPNLDTSSFFRSVVRRERDSLYVDLMALASVNGIDVSDQSLKDVAREVAAVSGLGSNETEFLVEYIDVLDMVLNWSGEIPKSFRETYGVIAPFGKQSMKALLECYGLKFQDREIE